MVHYIRFLRTPQVTATSKKTIDIASVVAVTTDLGDAYYAEDLDLLVQVVEAHSPHGIIHSHPVKWQGGSRASKFSISCNNKYSSRPVVLRVSPNDKSATHMTSGVPQFVDVWSDQFQLIDKQRADTVVERRLLLPNKSWARIWEETGDSIARHIWDASLGFLMYFNEALHAQSDKHLAIRDLLTSKGARRLRILELGAGCGIVGIALAQLVKCEMILTDLEDAAEILEKNTGCATPTTGSIVQSRILDWGNPIDDSSNFKFDLVLVSDCIYNPDSSLLLVETLRQLAHHAPKVTIMLGFKRRHEADTIFFDAMKQTSFETVEVCNIELPHAATDHDVDTPAVEFYIYRLRPSP